MTGTPDRQWDWQRRLRGVPVRGFALQAAVLSVYAAALFGSGRVLDDRIAALLATPAARPAARAWVSRRRLARAPHLARPAPGGSGEQASPGSGVGDPLVEAIVLVESGGNPRKVGSAGERGLMQLMPETWGEVTEQCFGQPMPFRMAFNPGWNRYVGRAYLTQLRRFLEANRDRWRADERSLLLAAYNGGPTRLEAAGFDLAALPASVRDYVDRVSALYDEALPATRLAAARLEPASAGTGT